MCGDCFVCIYLVCQCDGLELGRRNRRITVRGVAARINTVLNSTCSFFLSQMPLVSLLCFISFIPQHDGKRPDNVRQKDVWVYRISTPKVMISQDVVGQNSLKISQYPTGVKYNSREEEAWLIELIIVVVIMMCGSSSSATVSSSSVWEIDTVGLESLCFE